LERKKNGENAEKNRRRVEKKKSGTFTFGKIILSKLSTYDLYAPI